MVDAHVWRMVMELQVVVYDGVRGVVRLEQVLQRARALVR